VNTFALSPFFADEFCHATNQKIQAAMQYLSTVWQALGIPEEASQNMTKGAAFPRRMGKPDEFAIMAN